jgi:hypothetical protein
MKRSFLVISIVCFGLMAISGPVTAKDYEAQKKIGDYTIVLKIDKNPPVTGNNNMEIALRDSAGKAFTDAKVAVSYSMPPMPGMPAASYKVNPQPKGSVYTGILNFSMAGSWNLEVKVTKDGKTLSSKFTLDVK